jgi:predicted site-specific integrase-resolvase
MTKPLLTQQVADKIRVTKRTLLRWLYAGKIPEVRRERLGVMEVRLWSAADVKRAQRFKRDNYGKKLTKS